MAGARCNGSVSCPEIGGRCNGEGHKTPGRNVYTK